MSYHKTLRTALGFTQKAFANYLCISRSLLSMAEVHERELPTSALVKLAELELLLQQPHEPVENLEALKRCLGNEEDECRFQVQKLSTQLSTIKSDFKAFRKGLGFLRHLETKQELSPALKLEKLRLISVIGNCNLSAQTKLELRLVAYQAKLNWLKTFQGPF